LSRSGKRYTQSGVATGFQQRPHPGPPAEVALERRWRGEQLLARDDLPVHTGQTALAVLVARPPCCIAALLDHLPFGTSVKVLLLFFMARHPPFLR